VTFGKVVGYKEMLGLGTRYFVSGCL